MDILQKTDEFTKQIKFLVEIDKMKSVFRQSLLSDGSRHENDAEHSWHLCMYAVVLEQYANPGTDMLRVLKMVLVHDLVEIYAGDTYLYDAEGNKTKAEREKQAADKLYAMCEKGSELRRLWEEFDASETQEAKFANCLDRLQPIMLNYLTQGKMWLKNKVHKGDVLARGYRLVNYGHPRIVDFLNELLDECVEKGYLLP